MCSLFLLLGDLDSARIHGLKALARLGDPCLPVKFYRKKQIKIFEKKNNYIYSFINKIYYNKSPLLCLRICCPGDVLHLS